MGHRPCVLQLVFCSHLAGSMGRQLVDTDRSREGQALPFAISQRPRALGTPREALVRRAKGKA